MLFYQNLSIPLFNQKVSLEGRFSVKAHACPTRAPTGGGRWMAARASWRWAWRCHGASTLHWDQAGRGACAGPWREERLSPSSISPLSDTRKSIERACEATSTAETPRWVSRETCERGAPPACCALALPPGERREPLRAPGVQTTGTAVRPPGVPC